MGVDVVTYLFNFLAERLKHGHAGMSSRDLRLHRLYMELIPPFLSVMTLLIVTVLSFRQAIETILQTPIPAMTTTSLNSTEAHQQHHHHHHHHKYYRKEDENGNIDPPNISIMLLFSGLNLILDALNVGCFARVDQAIGVPGHFGHHEHHHRHHDGTHMTAEKETPTMATEVTPLIMPEDSRKHEANDDDDADSAVSTASSSDEATVAGYHTGITNLNMCSAWTHIAADTLRSVAVLVAAGISTVFPQVLPPADADAWGAIVVSIIIVLSLGPLVQGLCMTACKIVAMWNSSTSDSNRSNSNVNHGTINGHKEMVILDV